MLTIIIKDSILLLFFKVHKHTNAKFILHKMSKCVYSFSINKFSLVTNTWCMFVSVHMLLIHIKLSRNGNESFIGSQEKIFLGDATSIKGEKKKFKYVKKEIYCDLKTVRISFVQYLLYRTLIQKIRQKNIGKHTIL